MATTSALWASGTPATSGTTWANVANAAGANNSSVATYTTSTNGAVGYISLTGYGAQAAIGAAPDSVDSVAVTVWARVNNTSRFSSIEVALYDGGTLVGAAQTMTRSTSTSYSQAFTFSGVTWANLAGLTVRVTGTKTGTLSGVMSVDAARAVVSYTPAPITWDASGTVPVVSGVAVSGVTGTATARLRAAGTVAAVSGASGSPDTVSPISGTVAVASDVSGSPSAILAVAGTVQVYAQVIAAAVILCAQVAGQVDPVTGVYGSPVIYGTLRRDLTVAFGPLTGHPLAVVAVAGHPLTVGAVTGHPLTTAAMTAHPARVCSVIGNPVTVAPPTF